MPFTELPNLSFSEDRVSRTTASDMDDDSGEGGLRGRRDPHRSGRGEACQDPGYLPGYLLSGRSGSDSVVPAAEAARPVGSGLGTSGRWSRGCRDRMGRNDHVARRYLARRLTAAYSPHDLGAIPFLSQSDVSRIRPDLRRRWSAPKLAVGRSPGGGRCHRNNSSDHRTRRAPAGEAIR